MKKECLCDHFRVVKSRLLILETSVQCFDVCPRLMDLWLIKCFLASYVVVSESHLTYLLIKVLFKKISNSLILISQQQTPRLKTLVSLNSFRVPIKDFSYLSCSYFMRQCS